MWTISLLDRCYMKSSAGFVRPIGTMQTQRRRRVGYKGKYSQRYPLGQRFGYGTRTPYGKPSYGTFGSYGQSAVGSRFLSGGRSSYDGHTEGIYRHWQTHVRQKKRLSPMDLSLMGSPLMGSRQRAVSSLQTAVFPCGGRKRKEKVSAQALVINGPNLNFLGIREKGIYGTQDYNDLLNMIAQKGLDCHAAISVFQSNHEVRLLIKSRKRILIRQRALSSIPALIRTTAMPSATHWQVLPYQR